MHLKDKIFLFFLLLSNASYSATNIENHLRKIELQEEKREVENIDCIYLINLDQRPAKRNRSFRQLAAYQIIPHRVSAIYGWSLTPEIFRDLGLKFEIGMSAVNPGWKECSHIAFCPGTGECKQLDSSCYGKRCFHGELSPGAVGCALSHLSILKHAYEAGYQAIWVLEDDFLIVNDPHQIADYIQKLEALVGKEGWDVLFTDRKCGFEYFVDSHRQWRPDMPSFDQYSLLEVKDLSEDFIKIGARARTHSMVISRSGIKKIYEFVIQNGIFNPYDAEISFVPGINLYCLKRDLITFESDVSDTTGKNF